ncbi:hypothetical protein [Helicobacter trogontum]|uniref:hypothetical protein n=1 Tax=Helicobacter trogontum TaxID=50960 RepID=UPI000B108714|nr:hypothetical protein [Helicobacter trogontum]
MDNKEQIKKLRDNAELAMASYGYFHLTDKTCKHNDKDEKRLKEFRELKAKALGKDIDESIYPTYIDILNIEYNSFLGGDFTPTQTQRFFSRYDLLIHQPNTESGFSATLFGEKRKQKNTESKEISYTSEYGYTNYILAIRGTEPLNRGDIGADTSLILRNLPKK